MGSFVHPYVKRAQFSMHDRSVIGRCRLVTSINRFFSVGEIRTPDRSRNELQMLAVEFSRLH